MKQQYRIEVNLIGNAKRKANGTQREVKRNAKGMQEEHKMEHYRNAFEFLGEVVP